MGKLFVVFVVLSAANLFIHFSKAAHSRSTFHGLNKFDDSRVINRGVLQRNMSRVSRNCVAKRCRRWWIFKQDKCTSISITLPSDTLPSCKDKRNSNLKTQQKFYRLSTPPKTPKAYPSETKDFKDALIFPILDQPTHALLVKSLTDTNLEEQEWITMYKKMALRNLVLERLSLVKFRDLKDKIMTFSDYMDIFRYFRDKQKENILLFVQIGKYLRYPSQEEPFKEIFLDNLWQQDYIFVQQRLAGLNTMSLRMMNSGDKVYNFFNKNFDWDGAIKKTCGEDSTFEEMVEKGLVYVADYPSLHGLINTPDLADKNPNDNRNMRKSTSPIGVFVSAKGNSGVRTLKVVAIQHEMNSQSPVYTPADGLKWLFAKEEFQTADFIYLELIEHLLKTHLSMEPICVIMRRTLSEFHPLHQIFKWHCRGLFTVNSLGLNVLLAEGQFLHSLSAIGHVGSFELLNRVYPSLSWEDTDFKNNLEKRGVHEPDKLPYFPYRDDGLLIWKEIGEFAEEYVNAYYNDDNSVSKDYELQHFADELSDQGAVGINGGKGKYKGFPTKILTKTELMDVVKRVVFMPVQHHSVNYPVAYYGAVVPNYPMKLYDDPRVPYGEFGMASLPQLNAASKQVGFTLSLGSFRFDKFFDYKDKMVSNRGKYIVGKYHDRLMGEVQNKIAERNDKRLKDGFLTYPYFLPKWMPNSIHT